jgi:hypothetical protein
MDSAAHSMPGHWKLDTGLLGREAGRIEGIPTLGLQHGTTPFCAGCCTEGTLEPITVLLGATVVVSAANMRNNANIP